MTNRALYFAKRKKNDEFYTRYEDVEAELLFYREEFKNKVVYCNCDNPDSSAFAKFFMNNFDKWELKKLICSCISSNSQPARKLEMTSTKCVQSAIEGDGDFRSPECLKLLHEADIVCTNPPFSLAREYIEQLFTNQKKFLIINSINLATFRDIFPKIVNNEMWGGYTHPKRFFTITGASQSLGNIQWWTNLNTANPKQELLLSKSYSPSLYPRYDNYNAIEVSKVKDIPKDYYGIMGVPITFLDKYSLRQFRIIWGASGNTRTSAPPSVLKELGYIKNQQDRGGCAMVKGKRVYWRLLVQRRR